MAIRIRLIEPTDYDAIITVIDDWWGGRHMAPMLPRLFFEHFRETSFIAELDGKRIGFLIGFLSNTRPHEAYIHFVGVHPDHRKAGIGRLLYERFFDLMGQKGRSIVRCVTSPVNRNSIAFHRRMGFRIVPSGEKAGGISVHPDHDGPGESRVLFVRKLKVRI